MLDVLTVALGNKGGDEGAISQLLSTETIVGYSAKYYCQQLLSTELLSDALPSTHLAGLYRFVFNNCLCESTQPLKLGTEIRKIDF